MIITPRYVPIIPAQIARNITKIYCPKSKPKYPSVKILRPCWTESTSASVEIKGFASNEKEFNMAAMRGAVPPMINDSIIEIVEPKNKWRSDKVGMFPSTEYSTKMPILICRTGAERLTANSILIPVPTKKPKMKLFKTGA